MRRGRYEEGEEGMRREKEGEVKEEGSGGGEGKDR